jgi:hypothetical protein
MVDQVNRRLLLYAASATHMPSGCAFYLYWGSSIYQYVGTNAKEMPAEASYLDGYLLVS